MTYSIIARDPNTGFYAVAVASRFFAVGALVPHLRGGKCAVATQAFVNPVWGLEAAAWMATGESAKSVLTDLVARDRGADQRQIHMIDMHGDIAAHTGAACIDWAGHLIGDGVSVAGNMLAGPQVVAQTLKTYQANMALPLAERLMTAMEAGEAAGGDKRGRQSAALRIHRQDDYPWIDLRADDHIDPLAELRRLYDVAQERFVHFAEVIPTRANPSGVPDRTGPDAAIAAEDQRREKAHIPSQSFATPLVPD
ncbi:MAG: DUF1028 domain-containing protein [Paracoccaceae bacterium]